MKIYIKMLCVAFLLIVSPVVFSAPIDFDNLNVASTEFGYGVWEGRSNLMASYNNKVYFVILGDGITIPSKVCCYDPSDGLSNEKNHSVIAESTGQFFTIRVVDDLLYFSDTLGGLYTYDGTTLIELPGTPFSGSEFVSSISGFNGTVYFGTSNSKIYRYNFSVYEQVYAPNEPRQRIVDMIPWQKDGYLYVSIGPPTYCCPATAYLIRSNTGDSGSWERIYEGFYYVSNFISAPDHLYTAIVDTAYSYSSSVRKSSDGLSFPVISTSGGEYKTFGGTLFYDEIAYVFANQRYGYGYKIIDENGTVSLVPNQNWSVTYAVELNNEIYALASSSQYNQHGTVEPADVYLITTSTGSVPNQNPTANAGEDQTVELESSEGTVVNLDGSASTDPDSSEGTNDDIESFKWYIDDELIAEGEQVSVLFPLGVYTVVLKVTDKGGLSDEDEVLITVQDTTRPEITIIVEPNVLWPPNNKMRDVLIDGSVSDLSDDVVLSFTVDDEYGEIEPVLNGFGETIQLKASRKGKDKDGRTYTITVEAVDGSGNSVVENVTVSVPHDQRK